MGTCDAVLRELSRALCHYGFRVGIPNKELNNPHATRHQPGHEALWYWRAIRRFFEDMGLPPIAEIPEDRLSYEERKYYTRTFARSLGQSLDGDSFICCDTLTSLVLPLVHEAVQLSCVNCREWFFFSNPAMAVWQLKHDNGTPPKLAEFTWRNIAAAAGRHNHGSIRFINMDSMDHPTWQNLLEEISHYYGCPMPRNLTLPVPVVPYAECELLSPRTLNLYEAMRVHSAGMADWRDLAKIATETWQSQVEENGWQYLDCLDCGEMDAHARRLLDGAVYDGNDPDMPLAATDEETWLNLLDSAERKLLQAKQDYETRLFLQAQSISIKYMNCLADERLINKQNQDRISEKRKKIAQRRKNRYRKLFAKTKSQ